MNEINSQHTPYISINSLSAYLINENCFISIQENGNIQKTVEFSFDRQCLYSEGIELIKDENMEQFVDMEFDVVKEKIGQPHIDIGSGFYIPAYITEDAYLISFDLEDEIVFRITKRDLLTNRIV